MKITYNKNPLYTTIDLDESEKRELWYKIKIEEMNNLLFDAHFHLEEGKYFDLARSREAVDPKYYFENEDKEAESKKSKLDERVDMLFNLYLEELQSAHCGDCTCVPCTCDKCLVESLLGIDTTKGLGKHMATKIQSAFGKDNERSIDEAIRYLEEYEPSPPADTSVWDKMGGFDQYIPGWKADAKKALVWLITYRDCHFSN